MTARRRPKVSLQDMFPRILADEDECPNGCGLLDEPAPIPPDTVAYRFCDRCGYSEAQNKCG